MRRRQLSRSVHSEILYRLRHERSNELLAPLCALDLPAKLFDVPAVHLVLKFFVNLHTGSLCWMDQREKEEGATMLSTTASRVIMPRTCTSVGTSAASSRLDCANISAASTAPSRVDCTTRPKCALCFAPSDGPSPSACRARRDIDDCTQVPMHAAPARLTRATVAANTDDTQAHDRLHATLRHVT